MSEFTKAMKESQKTNFSAKEIAHLFRYFDKVLSVIMYYVWLFSNLFYYIFRTTLAQYLLMNFWLEFGYAIEYTVAISLNSNLI